MFYTIHYTTKFRYSQPISESIMEARMQPRNDGPQRTLRFELRTKPRARIFGYRDFVGNTVHTFDVPGRHSNLTIIAEAVVEIQPFPELPRALPPESWEALDALVATGDYHEALMPSHFATPTPLLYALMSELSLRRQGDPLSLLHELNTSLYDILDYNPNSTHVESPIDDALFAREGVCQDYSHIMIALVRELGIPCRYVSGYLAPHASIADRSTPGATHAWVEALVPGFGWVGFDPTNNLIAGERHIRVAIGRDYADVPPTKGFFKGQTETELDVAVLVTPSPTLPIEDEFIPASGWAPEAPNEDELVLAAEAAQQQQQQQQQ